MAILLSAISLILLLPGIREREGREKKLYVALLCIAVAAGYAAGAFAVSDHVGASLSGMISIFMR